MNEEQKPINLTTLLAFVALIAMDLATPSVGVAPASTRSALLSSGMNRLS